MSPPAMAGAQGQQPLIVYELNEVPWRVVDWFVRKHPHSHWARLLKGGRSYTTVTRDAGELHPWSTWPSLHRGVPNTLHKITFLNQEIQTEYQPIWELIRRAGHRIGIFGSLQTHRLFPSDLDAVDFYVPDTFSPDAKTHPRRYEAFQRVNLRMTQRDGAAARSGLPASGSFLADAARLPLTGLRMKTGLELARHLLAERRVPTVRTRRSTMQAPVAFDFFLDALSSTQPAFATFFTNHVAGMMHRYWNYVFPEDFETPPPEDATRSENVEFAMRLADAQLGELMKIATKRGAKLVVASSMGQEAVHRGTYIGELRLEEPTKLFGALGFREKVEINLAMQPDFAFELESPEATARLKNLVEGVTDSEGGSLFTFKTSGATLNLNLVPSPLLLREGRVHLRQASETSVVTLDAVGLVHLDRDQGTGYHQPRGILVTWPQVVATNGREEIPLEAVAPSFLEHFSIARPEYMAPPVSL